MDNLEFHFEKPDASVQSLIDSLRAEGWMTRKQIAKRFGWPERMTRSLAEAAGAEIVRGPKGFNHVSNCTVDEITHAAKIAESQGQKMVAYAQELKKHAHKRIAA